MDSLNSKLKAFNTSLYRRDKDTSFPPECLDLIFGLMCHHSFPLCDHNSETPVPRKVNVCCTAMYNAMALSQKCSHNRLVIQVLAIQYQTINQHLVRIAGGLQLPLGHRQ